MKRFEMGSKVRHHGRVYTVVGSAWEGEKPLLVWLRGREGKTFAIRGRALEGVKAA